MNKELVYNSVNSVIGKKINESIDSNNSVANSVYNILNESAEFYDGQSDILLECASKALAYNAIGDTNSVSYVKFLFEAIDKLASTNGLITEDYVSYLPIGAKASNNAMSKDADAHLGDYGLVGGTILGINGYRSLAANGKLWKKANQKVAANIKKATNIEKGLKDAKTASKTASKSGNLTLKILYKFFPKLATKLGPKIAKMGTLAAKGALIGGTGGMWLVVELVLFIIGKGGVRLIQSNTRAGKWMVKKIVSFIKKHPQWTKFLCTLWTFLGYGDFKKAALTKAIEYGYITPDEAQNLEVNSNLFKDKYADNYTEVQGNVAESNNIEDNIDMINEEEQLRAIIRESLDELNVGKALGTVGKNIAKRFKNFGRSFGKINKFRGILRRGNDFKLTQGPFKDIVFKVDTKTGKIMEKSGKKFVKVTDGKKLNSVKRAMKRYESILASNKAVRNGGIRNALFVAGIALAGTAGLSLLNGSEEQVTSPENPSIDTPTPTPIIDTKPRYTPEEIERIKLLQRRLINAGYYLGNYGPEGNGVDGKVGPMTRQCALAAGVDIKAWIAGNIKQKIEHKNLSNDQMRVADQIAGVSRSQMEKQRAVQPIKGADGKPLGGAIPVNNSDLQANMQQTADRIAQNAEVPSGSKPKTSKERKKEEIQQIRNDAREQIKNNNQTLKGKERQQANKAVRQAKRDDINLARHLDESVQKCLDLANRMEEL